MALLQIVFGLPGDLVLMLGSCISSVVRFPGGSWTVFFSYVLGTCTGGYLLFELGRRYGTRILKAPWISRLLGGQSLEGAQRTAKRHGDLVFLFSKFMPGINAITLLMGGAFRWRRWSSYLYITIAALGHNLLLFLVGRAIGNNLDAIAGFLQEYSRAAILALCAVVLAIVLLVVVRYRKKPAAHSGDAP
jgi:membrane protein DedA with SNARE-associated domain